VAQQAPDDLPLWQAHSVSCLKPPGTGDCEEDFTLSLESDESILWHCKSL